MVSAPIGLSRPGSIKLAYLALSFFRNALTGNGSNDNDVGAQQQHHVLHHFSKRVEVEKGTTTFTVFAVLIPVLVLISGLFAGLTLGYMSLDETQLQVLCISGTPKQREYAKKILPIRKNGHLLLVTLLLANMIVNESLPVIAEPVLGGGIQSVVVSTTLIIIFAEIIPQSLFTRYGLYLGAKMAPLTKCLIYALGIVSWPVAKLLELVLGPHHGIIYRRAELKELIAMHAMVQSHGGDLKSDTVNIIGATLDLQEKDVTHAMTPIANVFMVSIDAKLDYALLKKIVSSGHSRVPVYEEIEVPHTQLYGIGSPHKDKDKIHKLQKIVGILLVKQCVLLDPNDATPIRNIPLNKVPIVPKNESLLGLLDKFQEGRSHMAIVSRISVDKAKSVKSAVKQSMTQRLRKRVGISDDSSSSEDSSDSEYNVKEKKGNSKKGDSEKDGDEEEDADAEKKRKKRRSKKKVPDIESGEKKEEEAAQEPKAEEAKGTTGNGKISRFSKAYMSSKEQFMPADAVLAKEGAHELLQGINPAIQPLGIITLEDVLEELIGEEIYDEFDEAGAKGDPYVHQAHQQHQNQADGTQPQPQQQKLEVKAPVPTVPAPKTSNNPLKFNILRSRSAPPSPRESAPPLGDSTPPVPTAPGSGSATPVSGGATRPRSALLAEHLSSTSIASAVAGGGAGGGGGVGSTVLQPAPAGGKPPKGTRFKSQTLGELGEEHPSEVGQPSPPLDLTTETEGEARIPDEKDKSGPDKPSGAAHESGVEGYDAKPKKEEGAGAQEGNAAA